MLIYDVSPDTIERAIAQLNEGFYAGDLRFDTTRKWQLKDGRWRVRGVLRTRTGRSPGARRSGSGRRTNSLDWQAHYDFMALLFSANPEARIQSMDADYRNELAFYATCGRSKGRNLGSLMQPVTRGELVGEGRE